MSQRVHTVGLVAMKSCEVFTEGEGQGHGEKVTFYIVVIKLGQKLSSKCQANLRECF